MLNASIDVEHPESYLEDYCQGLLKGHCDVVFLRFSFDQYYFDVAEPLMLLVAVDIVDGEIRNFALGRWTETIEAQLCRLGDDFSVKQWARSFEFTCVDLQRPLMLLPVAIAKPWGQEIWYTGIEARGQALVTDGCFSVPLPWVLAVMPKRLVSNRQRELNLLKVLDPLPEAVYGDLYFEQHQEKQEVYVVTHVNTDAWPSGNGGIFIGFDPEVRAQFETDAECKLAFSGAVEEYEAVRRDIDSRIDSFREKDGVALDEPVAADVMKGWVARLPEALSRREVVLRAAMDAFKGLKKLRVGDVLKVPCYTPHSLLHGVRTIEFQTPVYERQVISFAQKVLTQAHWDTADAIEAMKLDAPQDDSLPCLSRKAGCLVEEVVSFTSFYVWRVTLEVGAQFRIDSIDEYALVMGVSGTVSVSGSVLSEEQAMLIHGGLSFSEFTSESSKAIFLVSFPK